MKIIYDFDVMEGESIVEEGAYEEAAIFLGGWFEDIISQTGLWQVFTSECEKRYGTKLPFFELDGNYYSDEVNLEDIQFIIWHCLQSRSKDKFVYTPNNQPLRKLSKKIYDFLAIEYPVAPENERLKDFYDFSDPTLNVFIEYRNKIEWFFMNSYINMGCYRDYCESMEEKIEEFTHNENNDDATIEILLYSHKVETILFGRTPLLGITAPEYMKLLQEHNHADHNAPYMNIDFATNNLYLVEKEEDDYYIFKKLTGDKRHYKVDKTSLNENTEWLVVGDTVVTSTLFKYGEYWNHNGAMRNYSTSENPGLQNIIKEIDLETSGQKEKKSYDDFLEITQGKRIMFFKNPDELSNFVSTKLKYKNTLPTDLLKWKDSPVMATVSPKNGLAFLAHISDCVAAPNNPYYNQEHADENAIALLIGKHIIPYEISCYLLDNGYLKDARLDLSIDNKESEKEFVKQHAQFLMDYFHNKCREKDFVE